MIKTNDGRLNENTTGAPRGAPVVFSGSDEALFADQLSVRRTIEKFVVFFLNNRCYGVSARAVVEVARPLAVAVLPRSPEWLAGVANLRGEVIPVLDPSKIFGDAAAKHSTATKFIILRAKIFDSPIALPVARLSELVAFGDDELESATGENNVFIFAAVDYRATTLHLIDAERMLASITAD